MYTLYRHKSVVQLRTYTVVNKICLKQFYIDTVMFIHSEIQPVDNAFSNQPDICICIHTHTHTHIYIFVLPSTGFEPTPLIHCSTIRLALRPAHSTTSTPYIYKYNKIYPNVYIMTKN